MPGFPVNNAPGKIIFENGITVPDTWVKFRDDTDLDLGVPQYEMPSVKVLDGLATFGLTEHGLDGSLLVVVSEQVLWDGDVAATNHAERAQYLKRNVAKLATITAASVAAADGLQTVQYFPWVGHAGTNVDMVVGAPVRGSIQRGSGVTFSIPVLVPSGAVSWT